MKRFAVDVVILPPDSIMDRAIEWNRMMRKTQRENIVLDKTLCLPHISLAMGCLREEQLKDANALLQSIALQHRELELHVPNIKTVKTASGDNVISFDIDLSPELARLHESIVNAFTPFLTQNATEADLYDLRPINPSSLDWINRFIPQYCFDHFWPHITLGFGEPAIDFMPYSFQASRLAICHLGNHCTCRKILAEGLLKSQ